jgi:hypothetical protein
VPTLGPFCLLLWGNPFNNKLTEGITLYRGAALDPGQIKIYQDLSTQPEEYCTFQTFTPCIRNRQFIENFADANTLFIMDVLCAPTVNLEDISEYPGEEEELVPPGVSFRVRRLEYDTKKKKHLIYLELRQRFNRKSFH